MYYPGKEEDHILARRASEGPSGFTLVARRAGIGFVRIFVAGVIFIGIKVRIGDPKR
jgi:hypothetical protein